MFARQAWNSDEAWLMDISEDLELDLSGFRSRNYVIAVDESTEERIGFGKLHTHGDYAEIVNLAAVDRKVESFTLLIEQLLEKAEEDGIDEVYFVPQSKGHEKAVEKFDFELIDSPPELLQEGDVYYIDPSELTEDATENFDELAEELGLEDATTKYST